MIVQTVLLTHSGSAGPVRAMKYLIYDLTSKKDASNKVDHEIATITYFTL